ncbi:hypothetical protein R1T43_09940 [Alteromonas sp. CI.11.F.A3]|uniref:hypothetical protein n=1 Tax=Alteromonas sp. CI.11.F.A3 TaxID=3079555 RepID=UPI0029435738|nr:hypothetical protein [Alteromonas sp. CI.11.F.A3]WOI39324.1 hypothetical protein R1T43_09940 [Alteromonas sp. CI.11.F.A3]
MSKISSAHIHENRRKLDSAYVSVGRQLRGVSSALLYGHLYKSESGREYESKAVEHLVDERKKLILEQRELPCNPKRNNRDMQRTMRLKSLLGDGYFNYKYNIELTYLFEELKESVDFRKSKICHITVQFKHDVSDRARASEGEFKKFKQKLANLMKGALGEDVRGFLVIERSYVKFVPGRSRSRLTALHAHFVIEHCSTLSKSDINNRVRQKFKRVSELYDTSVGVFHDYTVRRPKDAKVKTFKTPVDLGLVDYLSKEFDKPMIKGVKNYSVFGKNLNVRIRREWRFKQRVALDRAYAGLDKKVGVERLEFDIVAYFEMIINSVSRPPKLDKSLSEVA